MVIVCVPVFVVLRGILLDWFGRQLFMVLHLVRGTDRRSVNGTWSGLMVAIVVSL